MDKDFVAIPNLESSIRLFGGHMRTVSGGWKFFGQQHQSFELMCVVAGQQVTQIRNLPPMIYGPGEVLVISPGTWHVNANASQNEPMTYITCHFDMENLNLKSEIISNLANSVFRADSFFAKNAFKTSKQLIEISENTDLSEEEQRLKIQIIFLNFLLVIVHNIKKFKKVDVKYTDREAQLARSLATLMADNIKLDHPKMDSFEDNCQRLNISAGYGHRIFKRVYGITR
ncbi:AraC family transcriptional regulator [Levilactobacillus zymae]|uniref:AraC family transcriptional regulator n=1 Tax=Levilactobacillus zymae TaxID=267363 RepID=UPI0028B94FC7|nr:AraC family transcriptional regulator [Levilactobacillus zymae]MDT6981449.1 AraC family transcriptional regulator [Levilactobacillus zymae]